MRGTTISIMLTVFLHITLTGYAQENQDTTLQENGNKSSVKMSSWESFIKNAEVTGEGLFTIYQDNDKYYFEIGDNALGRDMLLGSRVSEISNTSKVAAGEMRKSPILIRFARDEQNVYMQNIVSDYISDSHDPISVSVKRNSIIPVLVTFPIETINPVSGGAVIDVTKFFSAEIPQVSPFNSKFKAGKLETASTRILETLSFPENTEVRTQLSYSNGENDPMMVIMHNSILLLPEIPMQPRYEDSRIGYFSTGARYFTSNKIGVQSLRYISRFNLTPRAEDYEKYTRGESVEPEKPIIFYIDNAFPEEWRKYIKEGIENWQIAFEAIGFKNAIIAKDYPLDDPTFHPEDIRYSCIRYISMPTANASGPRWVDPRSGEIIGGDVLWWHDVVERLRDWRFVQCGAVEPEAREENTGMELLGEMIRYVASHEVGHTLGLKHNMRASYAFPVDSLRSPSFTEKNGTTPSIMDYARFNYIAQPGDNVTRLSPPRMGPYDIFAIKWGYAMIPGVSGPEDELPVLNSWILEKSGNPVYQYGDQSMGLSLDPTSQTESLGDDAIKASSYGVANAKYIMNHLVEWTTEENGDFDFLSHMYGELIKQYERYVGHVMSYLGGVYIYRLVEGEEGQYFTPVEKERQKAALAWIMNELSTQHLWITNSEVEKRIGPMSNDLFKMQASTLDVLMSSTILARIQLYHQDYSCQEYLDDLHNFIWTKTIKNQPLNDFEKHLQASYINNLLAMMTSGSAPARTTSPASDEYLGNPSSSKTGQLDNLVKPILLGKIDETGNLLKKHLKNGNRETRQHYSYLLYILGESN